MTAPDAAQTSRLFLGIPLADEVREALLRRLPPEPMPGRRVPPEKWHLTLRFLGDTAVDAEQRLCDAMREAARTASLGHTIDVAFDRLGAFPRAARASVLWIGVSHGAPELRALAAGVEQLVRHAGFAAESRPFAPHLTLSRLQPPRDLHALIDALPPFDVRMCVDAVVLFRSHLGCAPSRYEALEHVALPSR